MKQIVCILGLFTIMFLGLSEVGNSNYDFFLSDDNEVFHLPHKN